MIGVDERSWLFMGTRSWPPSTMSNVSRALSRPIRSLSFPSQRRLASSGAHDAHGHHGSHDQTVYPKEGMLQLNTHALHDSSMKLTMHRYRVYWTCVEEHSPGYCRDLWHCEICVLRRRRTLADPRIVCKHAFCEGMGPNQRGSPCAIRAARRRNTHCADGAAASA